MVDLIARKSTRHAGKKYAPGERIPSVKDKHAKLLVGAKIAAYAPQEAPAVDGPVPVVVQAVATVEHTTAAAEPPQGYEHRAIAPEPVPAAPRKQAARKAPSKRVVRKKASD